MISKYPNHFVTFEDNHFEYWRGQYYKKVSILEKGQTFGELALIEKKNTRNATIKAESKTLFITLEKE